MKEKISNILIGIINILTAIFIIQINQSISYIDYVYIIGLNIKIEWIVFATLSIPIVLNMINIIYKREKSQSILSGISIVLIILSIAMFTNVLNNRIADMWIAISAIWIIILAIIHITISIKECSRSNLAINIIFCIISIILIALIYQISLIKVKYEQYINAEKAKNINTYEYAELYLVNKDNKYGYIDLEGNEVIPCKYDEVIIPFEDQNLALLKENNIIKITNIKGETLLEVDEKYNIDFIKRIMREISIKQPIKSDKYTENRYITLQQIDENIYEYNDKYNLYYNNYYDEQQEKQITECKLLYRENGTEYLTINTNQLPHNENEIYIYKNYNIPFINDIERGFYTSDGRKYLINSQDMYVVHFDNSNILFRNNDYYIFNNLQEPYKNVYILDNIYIVQLEDETYKILDRNLNVIQEKLANIEICEDIIIYSKNGETYGLMNTQAEYITEDLYLEIEGNEDYKNKLVEQITSMYEE